MFTENDGTSKTVVPVFSSTNTTVTMRNFESGDCTGESYSFEFVTLGNKFGTSVRGANGVVSQWYHQTTIIIQYLLL